MSAAQVTMARPPSGNYGGGGYRAPAPTPQLRYRVVGDGSGSSPGAFWSPAVNNDPWLFTRAAATTTAHLPPHEPFWPINGTAPPPTPPAPTHWPSSTPTLLTPSQRENQHSAFTRPPSDTRERVSRYEAAARSPSATAEPRGPAAWYEGLRAHVGARSADCIGLPPRGSCGESGAGCGGGGCACDARPSSFKKTQVHNPRAGESGDASRGEQQRTSPSSLAVAEAEKLVETVKAVERVEVTVAVEAVGAVETRRRARRRRESTFIATQTPPVAESDTHTPARNISLQLAPQVENNCRSSADAEKRPSTVGECIHQSSARKSKAKGRKDAALTSASADALVPFPVTATAITPAISDPVLCERAPLVSQDTSRGEDDPLDSPATHVDRRDGDGESVEGGSVAVEEGVEEGAADDGEGASEETASNAQVSASSWMLHDGLAWELWYEQKLKEDGARRRKEEKRQRAIQVQEEARQQEEEQRRLLEEENRKKWMERKKKQEEEERKKAEWQKKLKEQQEMKRNEERIKLCTEYARKAQEKKEEMRKAEAQQRDQEERLRAETELRRQAQKQRSLEQWRARSARHAKPLTGAIFNRDAQPRVLKPAFDFYNPEPWQF